MKIVAWFDVTNLGDERFCIDQVFERLVMEFQLTFDTDHHAIKVLFSQGSISPDAQLTAKHYIKGMRFRTPRLVAKFDAFDATFASGCFFERFGEAKRLFLRLSEFVAERGLTDDSVDIPSMLCDVEEAPAICAPCFVLLKRIVGKCEEPEAVSRSFGWKNGFERRKQAEEDPLYR